jgi:hypothetical protein
VSSLAPVTFQYLAILGLAKLPKLNNIWIVRMISIVSMTQERSKNIGQLLKKVAGTIQKLGES